MNVATITFRSPCVYQNLTQEKRTKLHKVQQSERNPMTPKSKGQSLLEDCPSSDKYEPEPPDNQTLISPYLSDDGQFKASAVT